MDVSSVSSSTSISQSQQNEDFAKKRVSLFQSSQFQMGGSQIDLSALSKTGGDVTDAVDNTQESQTLQLRDGTELTMPQQSEAQKASTAEAYASMSPEGAAAVKGTATTLANAAYGDVAAQREAANGNPDGPALLEASASTLQSAATDHVNMVSAAMFNKSTSAITATQFNDGMTTAMTTGMSAVEGSLASSLSGFLYKDGMANEIDTDAAELQTMIGEWPADGSSQTFTYHEVETDANGNQSLQEKTVTLTKDQASDLYNQLTTASSGLTDISDAESTQIQMKTQDYEQAMTTLSNIMKSFDDNLKGLIQNIKQ